MTANFTPGTAGSMGGLMGQGGVLDGLSGPTASTPEQHMFWGDEGLGASFWEHLTLQGLFSQPKVLVVRNAQAIPAAGLKELSGGLQRSPDSVLTLVCLEVAFDKGKPKIPAHILKLPCYLYAEKQQWITTIPPLGQSTLPGFIKAEAQRLGVTVSPQLFPRLAALMPSDAAAASCEMEKLALAAGQDGRIPESALSIIEHSADSDIFQLLQTIQGGSGGQGAAAVWQQMATMQQGGESFIFAFLSIITREARALWQLSMGEQPALPPFIINSKRVLAQSLGPANIAKMWEYALWAERSIKAGEQTPEQAFDILVADLCLLFQSQGAPASRRSA